MKIEFNITNGNIQITIPSDLLVFATEHNPDLNIKVIDTNTFIKKVLFELENNAGYDEDGLTGFQRLIDEAAELVVESGDDCVDII